MNKSILGAAAVALLGLASYGTVAQAQSRDPYYVLTSEYLGNGMALDVGQVHNANNQWWAVMLPTGTGDGQAWFLQEQPGTWWRMTNAWNGRNQCLDVAGDGSLYMDVCGAQIGQRWRIQNQNGAIFITNDFAPGRCLDVLSTGNLQVAALTPCNNLTGQRWTFHDTGVYP